MSVDAAAMTAEMNTVRDVSLRQSGQHAESLPEEAAAYIMAGVQRRGVLPLFSTPLVLTFRDPLFEEQYAQLFEWMKVYALEYFRIKGAHSASTAHEWFLQTFGNATVEGLLSTRNAKGMSFYCELIRLLVLNKPDHVYGRGPNPDHVYPYPPKEAVFMLFFQHMLDWNLLVL